MIETLRIKIAMWILGKEKEEKFADDIIEMEKNKKRVEYLEEQISELYELIDSIDGYEVRRVEHYVH